MRNGLQRTIGIWRMIKAIRMLWFAAGFLATSLICPPVAAEPLEPGTISVETSSAHPAPDYSVAAFVDAVGEVLSNKGFTMLEGHGHARLVAELLLTQVEIGTTNAKIPPAGKSSIAGGGLAGVGGSMVVPLPSGKLKVVGVLQTRLEVRIKRLGEDDILWKGAALTVRPAGSGNGQEKVVAADLAKAMFKTYPAQSERDITVP